jgi:hypothetical protein
VGCGEGLQQPWPWLQCEREILGCDQTGSGLLGHSDTLATVLAWIEGLLMLAGWLLAPAAAAQAQAPAQAAAKLAKHGEAVE